MAQKLFDKLSSRHSQTPVLKRLPLPSILIILLVAFVNAIVWAAAGIVLHFSPGLAGTAVLAYTLGLRHALDADHISAIDLMTRRLIAEGKRPYTVGTFFSLGHSTIVIVTSLVVAGTAAAVSSRFDSFSRVGGIIGTSVSAAFLIILGLINIYILYKLFSEMRRLLHHPNTTTDPFNPQLASPDDPQHQQQQPFQIQGGGCFFSCFRGLFRLIDRPWKMYPLGILFGLGFDTSSEVALLGISSIQASRGTSIWFILIFPLLFTAGMCLLDTIDGALMLALYTSTSFARDSVAILYYSIVLTAITIVVAVVIGTIQLLSLILNVAQPTGRFWDGVDQAGEHYDIIGGAICGSFVVFGGVSVLLYRPWRRWVARREERRARDEEVVGGEEDEMDGNDSVTSGLIEGDERRSEGGEGGVEVVRSAEGNESLKNADGKQMRPSGHEVQP